MWVKFYFICVCVSLIERDSYCLWLFGLSELGCDSRKVFFAESIWLYFLFSTDFCQLTLDPNTISDSLSLRERKTKTRAYPDFVTCNHPYHPERFVDTNQVLCEQGLSGRCYWEAVWGYENEVIQIGATYKNIKRKGRHCYLGRNDLSWSLTCKPTGCRFFHNYKMTEIPAVPGNRIGVYLDYKAGTLSFYKVSDTMTLLHRVETKFTEPLYPAFWLEDGGTLELCSGQIDSPEKRFS